MSKRERAKASCVKCGTYEGLFITLGNGERLPSYTIKIGEGIVCNACKDKAVA
jgi:hypothetical protein